MTRSFPGPDYQFGFEKMPRERNDVDPPQWRTYLLHPHAFITADDIGGAAVTQNPTTNYAEILLWFNERGARTFAEVTSNNLGHKLAILVDGTITSVPIIQSAITGGRVTITPGSGC